MKKLMLLFFLLIFAVGIYFSGGIYYGWIGKLEQVGSIEGKMIPEVEVGNVLPLQDQNGNVIPGKVLAINETTVTVDVNHLLADQDLHFTGKIVEMRCYS